MRKEILQKNSEEVALTMCYNLRGAEEGIIKDITMIEEDERGGSVYILLNFYTKSHKAKDDKFLSKGMDTSVTHVNIYKSLMSCFSHDSQLPFIKLTFVKHNFEALFI